MRSTAVDRALWLIEANMRMDPLMRVDENSPTCKKGIKVTEGDYSYTSSR